MTKETVLPSVKQCGQLTIKCIFLKLIQNLKVLVRKKNIAKSGGAVLQT